MPVQPVLGNSSAEIAGKGVFQGIAKSFDAAIGSPVLLEVFAALLVIAILFYFYRKIKK